MSKISVCQECGAVEHGNLLCNTCRTYMNDKFGYDLPPWPHKAEKPCSIEEVRAFLKKLDNFIGAEDKNTQ